MSLKAVKAPLSLNLKILFASRVEFQGKLWEPHLGYGYLKSFFKSDLEFISTFTCLFYVWEWAENSVGMLPSSNSPQFSASPVASDCLRSKISDLIRMQCQQNRVVGYVAVNLWLQAADKLEWKNYRIAKRQAAACFNSIQQTSVFDTKPHLSFWLWMLLPLDNARDCCHSRSNVFSRSVIDDIVYRGDTGVLLP